jgi:hypothetical protein
MALWPAVVREAGEALHQGGLYGVSYWFVKLRLQPLLLMLAVVGFCASVIGGIAWYRARDVSASAALLARLPRDEGITLIINMESLRQSGALAAMAESRVAEEPEYQAFVIDTGFDYQRDLDQLLAVFAKDSTYLLLKGRFNWVRLRTYAGSQGGACRNSFCQMSGSTSQRQISFFPLERNVLAMAVSSSADAAWRLAQPHPKLRAETSPTQPVWLSLSPRELRATRTLPASLDVFAQALEGSDRVELSLTTASSGLVAHMVAECRSAAEAEMLSSQLNKVAQVLRSMRFAGDPDGPSGGLVGALAGSSFHAEGQLALGEMPIEQAFLQSILGGSP